MPDPLTEPEVDWAVLCDYAFADAVGKMCIIGIFDNINARSVPTQHGQAAIVARIRGVPAARLRIKVELVRPTGSLLVRLEGTGTFGPNGVTGVHMQLVALQLPDYGLYAINVYLDDNLAHRTHFTVSLPPTTTLPS